MSQFAFAIVTKPEIERILKGFLACADFADCQEVGELQNIEWSDSAKQHATSAIEDTLKKINVDDWRSLVSLIPRHQDTDNDPLASIGVDLYYHMAGHGAGFFDHKSLTDNGLQGRIIEAIPKIMIDVDVDDNNELIFI